MDKVIGKPASHIMINPDLIAKIKDVASEMKDVLEEMKKDPHIANATEGREWALLMHLKYAADSAQNIASELRWAERYADLIKEGKNAA